MDSDLVPHGSPLSHQYNSRGGPFHLDGRPAPTGGFVFAGRDRFKSLSGKDLAPLLWLCLAVFDSLPGVPGEPSAHTHASPSRYRSRIVKEPVAGRRMSGDPDDSVTDHSSHRASSRAWPINLASFAIAIPPIISLKALLPKTIRSPRWVCFVELRLSFRGRGSRSSRVASRQYVGDPGSRSPWQEPATGSGHPGDDDRSPRDSAQQYSLFKSIRQNCLLWSIFPKKDSLRHRGFSV